MTSAGGLAGRILLVLGVSIFVASIVGALVGPKPAVGEEGTLVPGRGEVVGLLVWAQSAPGNVSVEVKGAAGVYYAKLRGDPLSYLSNATSFGVRVGEVEARRDVRGGVFLASAKLKVDLFTLNFALKRLNKTTGDTLSMSLRLGESLVVVVLPAQPGEPLTYRLSFHSRIAERLPPIDAGLEGVALAAVGAALLWRSKIKTRGPHSPAAGWSQDARGG